MAYAFLLDDLRGTPLSELGAATGKAATLAVNGQTTGTVTVPITSEDADTLISGDCRLRVYDVDEQTDRRTLLAHLRLNTAEEVGQADSTPLVAATFVDPYFTAQRRLIGRTSTGYSRGTSQALVDRGTIVSELLGAINSEAPSDLRIGNVTPSSGTYVAGWFYKPFSEVLSELSAPLDGFDWRIRPIEYAAQALTPGLPPGTVPGGYVGELDVAPSIGTYREDAALEYGPETLSNVRTYRRAVSNEGLATRVYSLPQGFPDNATAGVLTEFDSTAEQLRGRLEAVVPLDVAVDPLRAELLRAHVLIRKAARRTITMEPTRDVGRRVPRLGVDYEVGDVLPFRATVGRTAPARIERRLDVAVRVYAATVSVDEFGASSTSLVTVPS